MQWPLSQEGFGLVVRTSTDVENMIKRLMLASPLGSSGVLMKHFHAVTFTFLIVLQADPAKRGRSVTIVSLSRACNTIISYCILSTLYGYITHKRNLSIEYAT